MGEAVREMCSDPSLVQHVPIETLLAQRAVNEDMNRYRFISCHFPALLYLIYKFPLIYMRKYYREKWFPRPAGGKLAHCIQTSNARTVICISHRPAFWSSLLKTRRKSNFKIWGLLGEYGHNPGWKYNFWESIDGFLSPVSRQELRFQLPDHVQFVPIVLPARQSFCRLESQPGSKNHILLVCGYWGQGPIGKIIAILSAEYPDLHIHAVCGENTSMCREIEDRFGGSSRVHVHGVVDSLVPLMKKCAGIITKPGISTLVEAHAARRKIFLLKGMPVAEDNNARYALTHFDAEWFSWKVSRIG